MFAQLAAELAGRGFVVLRYDKRGVGQSGGRLETVTLRDYADDVVAAVKWLEKRKDVDKRRIAVVGHSEGGRSRCSRPLARSEIAALVLMASMGTRGVDLILEQQQDSLERAEDARKRAHVEGRPAEENPGCGDDGTGDGGAARGHSRACRLALVRSLLLFDPAEVMPRVRQPMLILHGELDKQVPPHHAKRLAEMAAARKKALPPSSRSCRG